MHPHKTDNIHQIRVPIRIEASHGMDVRGFSSSSTGFLCAPPAPGGERAPGCVLTGVTILGVTVNRLKIGAVENDWQSMELEFASPMKLDEIDSFLTRFADSFSVDLAQGERDPLHGMLTVTIRLTGLEVMDLGAPSDWIAITDNLNIKSTTAITVDRLHLQTYQGSALSQIFAEGMRNPDPKMKYISWFVVLEELERLFNFPPLFSPAEISQITAAVTLTPAQKTRLGNMMKGPSVTILSRAEKLYDILSQESMGTVININGVKTITLDDCKDLIKQRNLVAHKGTTVDTNILYNILFPLAIEALAFIENRKRPVRS
ncbi:hypothetical protein AD936_21650 [Gluconobacter japonicus]|nr:hypothetical protein AD936_21650 [Gluconobacter japonicus]